MSDSISAAALVELQRADAAEFAKILAKFENHCTRYRSLWNQRIIRAQELARAEGHGERPVSEITKTFADNSAKDLQGLNNEVASMLMRTSIIVAAATLLFAVSAVKLSTGKSVLAIVGITLSVIALLTMAMAFIVALRPLAPPFRRAWRDPYDKRVYRTLLVIDDFTEWVMNCWLGDRRIPVITQVQKSACSGGSATRIGSHVDYTGHRPQRCFSLDRLSTMISWSGSWTFTG